MVSPRPIRERHPLVKTRSASLVEEERHPSVKTRSASLVEEERHPSVNNVFLLLFFVYSFFNLYSPALCTRRFTTNFSYEKLL